MIPTNGVIGVCEQCGGEVEMTNDHIIPKWLILSLNNFGINYRDILEKADLTRGQMYQALCGPCNLAKGGAVIYKNPRVRKFMRTFVLEIYENLKRYDGPRKLTVICGCGRKEPCSVTPAVITPGLKTSGPEAHKHWLGRRCWCGYVDPSFE
jgi:hypothetical protein